MAKTNRELTHRLIYSERRDHWSCKCGFVLGRDGHKALYSLCKLFSRKRVSLSRNQDKLPNKSKHEKKPPSKVQRQTRRAGAGISKAALGLFEI
jgi:hypothetical protein